MCTLLHFVQIAKPFPVGKETAVHCAEDTAAGALKTLWKDMMAFLERVPHSRSGQSSLCCRSRR